MFHLPTAAESNLVVTSAAYTQQCATLGLVVLVSVLNVAHNDKVVHEALQTVVYDVTVYCSLCAYAFGDVTISVNCSIETACLYALSSRFRCVIVEFQGRRCLRTRQTVDSAISGWV